jgi:DNA processing protein
VIGSGLARLYPPENAALAEKIRAENGAIVSEFSMEIEPDRQTFPMRNRIISGWSHGILVVEAGLNSGALITASQALEQGRSVYAVPGHINAPSAMGSNRLIQQGAKLVMDASDILDDLQILLPDARPSAEAAARPLPSLSEEERRVYDAIEATETPIDDITEKTGLPSATVSSILLQLELKRLVKQLPGKYFVKLG